MDISISPESFARINASEQQLFEDDPPQSQSQAESPLVILSDDSAPGGDKQHPKIKPLKPVATRPLRQITPPANLVQTCIPETPNITQSRKREAANDDGGWATDDEEVTSRAKTTNFELPNFLNTDDINLITEELSSPFDLPENEYQKTTTGTSNANMILPSGELVSAGQLQSISFVANASPENIAALREQFSGRASTSSKSSQQAAQQVVAEIRQAAASKTDSSSQACFF